MCVRIAVEDGDGVRWIETQGELAELLGGPDAFRWYGSVTMAYEPDACLCPIDVYVTLRNRGWSVADGWDTHGVDYVATPKNGGER